MRIPTFATVLCLMYLSLFGSSISFAQGDGEIIASIGFDPKVHGFGFRNFGKNPDFEEDLTEDDLIRMFGAENVCIEGSTGSDCILYETADRWIEETIEKMNGGHCDGFSVSSLRMFLGRPFKGRKNPAAFQQGAVNLFDLRKTQLTSNYVSFYQTLTFLKETWLWRTPTFKKKPSEIMDMIADSMETKKELYTLEVWMKENGKLTRGHSILPIAVEEMEQEGIFRIHVYDNNFPGQTKYVTINQNNETWRYHTANNPAETSRDYVGSATTNTLALKRLSDRARARYECTFCDEDEAEDGYEAFSPAHVPTFMNASFVAAERRKQTVENMTVTSSGDVDLLITDPNGRRIGYDPVKKVTLNEVQGGAENVIPGNGEADNAPEYLLPISPANKRPYKLSVGGTDSEELADIQIYGPGFVVGFDEVSVDKGESLNMTFSQDGRELSFTASADGETPSLYIATDSGANKPSYEFEIGGIMLKAGKTISLKLDPDKGLIYFKDDDGDEDKYDVVISRTSPNGKVEVFEDYDMDIGDDNSYVLNFGAWDGKGKMCIKDDDDEDGNYDEEECTELDDEKPAK
jgi:hypothetical protein